MGGSISLASAVRTQCSEGKEQSRGSAQGERSSWDAHRPRHAPQGLLINWATSQQGSLLPSLSNPQSSISFWAEAWDSCNPHMTAYVTVLSYLGSRQDKQKVPLLSLTYSSLSGHCHCPIFSVHYGLPSSLADGRSPDLSFPSQSLPSLTSQASSLPLHTHA